MEDFLVFDVIVTWDDDAEHADVHEMGLVKHLLSLLSNRSNGTARSDIENN